MTEPRVLMPIGRVAAALLLLLSFILAPPAAAQTRVRFATFNVAMGLESEGELAARLATGEDENLRKLAEILQRMRPDVILLNEFDYHQGVDAAGLLNRNYLAVAQHGREPIEYPYHFVAPVNTGVDSGVDLNDNGVTGEPADARGYGAFPGQYGMLLLSRFPIDQDSARTFRNFLWSDMPGAMHPVRENGEPYWPESAWLRIPLSSKSHWDVPVQVDETTTVHFLASHPTPPVFDGPEDRNGRRNHDEIRFWVDYLFAGRGDHIYDDRGGRGGLASGETWIIAGDLNADPEDGDTLVGSIDEFTENPQVNWTCIPGSAGGIEAAREQGGANAHHAGNPEYDTADFNDRYTGNLRADYLIASRRNTVTACGVYWPATGEEGAELVDLSDHRMVWMDLEF